MSHAYLDHQAATPVLPEVFEAMRPFFTERFGNPSSLHRYGMEARDALAASRERLAAFLHAESPEEIIFTSGGTEAANLAVKGVASASRRRGTHIVCSDTEHPAVLNSVEFLEKEGFTASRVKVDARGWVAPAAVSAALTEKTGLICVHHVNHDIGTIEPIREIGRLASERGIPLFVDAVASAGWLPIDVQDLGATLLALAPHRFYGPKGVGVLYRSRRARLNSVQHGGVQEGGRRAGTENVAAIVGAGLAAEIAARQLPQRIAHTAKLQKRLWEGLARIPYCQLNGPEPGPDRISTNLNISFEFIEGEGIALMADVQGLAVASGASCVSKALKVSPVLKAIGLDHALAQGNILLSLGQDNTEQEIDFAVRTLTSIVAKLRGMSPLWDEFERGAIKSVIQPRGPHQPSPQRTVSSTETSR
jgi:cysteine desulfurase